ncbi:MAG: putative metal-binding motif-containing protein [Labilithrix sp.]|nr:putative metal-binding motif-containing protein [Labilithrix sp.]
MHVRSVATILSLCVAVSAMACSGASKRSGFDSETDKTEGAGPREGSFQSAEAGAGSPCAANNLNADPDADLDGDGYPLKYDCNECDPNVNRGAFDVPGNGIDEDCDGIVDNEPADCDSGLTITTSDPMDGARAIGLCKEATDDQMWGVVEAKWVRPDGAPLTVPVGYGVLPSFGVNAAQAGATVLAISSGTARSPSQPGYQNVSGHDKKYSHGTPPGYPKESPSCSGSGGFGFASGSHDGAALKVKVRVPSNAKSFKYQQNFFTYEFPGYICDDYNDFFVTIMDPKPAGLPDGNIAFDQDGNPISVNNSLLQVCAPQNAGGKSFSCPLGNGMLAQTGFEGHAATGWLTTTAPVDAVRGKEITLMWAIWDQGDHVLDSTALIDDFTWSVDAADGAQTLPSPPK